jgi:2-haloalkanoic acid dehalogenase type II
MTVPPLGSFEVITFDCYGTLIDWETGIRKAFHDALLRTGAKTSLDARVFELYAVEEQRLEKETPHLSYRGVLTKSALSVARKVGWDLSEDQASFLAEDLPRWVPFSDTNPALEALGRRHSLGILSNVDNDLLAGTLKHLKARFEILITAENVQSYKPAYPHFNEARRIIGDRHWLHVAASQYHDIEPALKLGISAVWVNRKNIPLSEKRVPVVKDLTQLTNQIGQFSPC